ncbi:YaeC family lipoprotein [Bradyrhizobium elkanii]
MMRILMTAVAAVTLLVGTARAETVRVGVTAGPHAEILEVVKKVAAGHGFDIKVVEFTDYVIPNQALALGDLEANSFQHEPYLKNQISKTGWKIVKVANTIASPQGVYSLKYKKLADLPDGARVAIANDPSNGARGLMILALHGVIKLKDSNNVATSIADIADNPKHLRFVELDAARSCRVPCKMSTWSRSTTIMRFRPGSIPPSMQLPARRPMARGSTSLPCARRTRTSPGSSS